MKDRLVMFAILAAASSGGLSRRLAGADAGTPPLDWAMTQTSLGFVLTRLGEREGGTERLQEAATAYREALKEWKRERVPRYWATAQNNIGVVLIDLGKREVGTARLEEAVRAFRNTLSPGAVSGS